jgi:carbamoyltransferase
MRVLCLSPLDKDATAAAVQDGRILFAAAEERYSRVKQHAGFPARALDAALAHAGWSAADVDVVAYPFLDAAGEARLIARALLDDEAFRRDYLARGGGQDPEAALREADARVPARAAPIHGLCEPNQRLAKDVARRLFYRLAGVTPSSAHAVARRMARRWARRAVADHARWNAELSRELAARELLGKLKRSEHHTGHAAAAWLGSGFDRALVVTLDGYGSGLAGSVSLAEGGALRRLAALPVPHSLGTFYEMVTSSLGFHPDRHAGKIVGLAAYGDPRVLAPVLLARVERFPGGFRLLDNLNVFFSRHLAARYPMVDVAAAWQHVLELLACEVVAHWVKATGCDSLVLSGGVAANVKLNQRLHALPGVRRTFVDPDMGDGGCGVGLARLLSWPGGTPQPLHDVYLGPAFSESECRAALEAAGLPFTRPAPLAPEVARRLHAGEVVARFDGRMEYGPRALGNRSVLYHAREPGVNQWLNRRLGRTEFMPFAPVTRAAAAARCYAGLAGAEHAAEFMTITCDCTPWMRAHGPAAVHVDGTARPQLLRREVNPAYDDILSEYEKRSGLPSLVNTSFNMHEEPIVCTPQDAIRAFRLGRLDALVLGPFLVENPEARADRAR